MFDLVSYTLGQQQGGGITPSGSIELTSNGTYDVTQYASAQVSVDIKPVMKDSITIQGANNYGYTLIVANYLGSGTDGEISSDDRSYTLTTSPVEIPIPRLYKSTDIYYLVVRTTERIDSVTGNSGVAYHNETYSAWTIGVKKNDALIFTQSYG